MHPADFWWHVRYGELLLDGGVPALDPFTFTQAGAPYLYGYWLSDLTLALVFHTAGLPGAVLFNAIAFTGAYGLLLNACRGIAGGSLRVAAAATAIAFAISTQNWTVRPQTLSVVFFAGTVWLLARYLAGIGSAKLLIGLPAIMLLWANSHGAFLAGLLLQSAAVAGAAMDSAAHRSPRRKPRDPRPLALVAAASLAVAALLTPQGLQRLPGALSLTSNPSVRAFALEWAPTSIDSPPGIALMFGVAVTLALLVWVRRLPPLWLVIPAVGFTALGWLSLRSVIWAGLALAPLSAWLLGRVRATEGRPVALGRLPTLAMAVGFSLLAVLALPWLRPALPLPQPLRALTPPDMPWAAAGALVAAQPRRVFADSLYASYLIWRLPSHNQLFIDPRFELFPPELWEQYGTISGGLAPELLASYQVDAVLAHPDRQAGLTQWLQRQPGWRLLHSDDYSSVWVRSP